MSVSVHQGVSNDPTDDVEEGEENPFGRRQAGLRIDCVTLEKEARHYPDPERRGEADRPERSARAMKCHEPLRSASDSTLTTSAVVQSRSHASLSDYRRLHPTDS
jgi:hypothetical protein